MPSERSGKTEHISFRVAPELHRELTTLAEGLGVELSALVRQMVVHARPEFERRHEMNKGWKQLVEGVMGHLVMMHGKTRDGAPFFDTTYIDAGIVLSRMHGNVDTLNEEQLDEQVGLFLEMYGKPEEHTDLREKVVYVWEAVRDRAREIGWTGGKKE